MKAELIGRYCALVALSDAELRVRNATDEALAGRGSVNFVNDPVYRAGSLEIREDIECRAMGRKEYAFLKAGEFRVYDGIRFGRKFQDFTVRMQGYSGIGEYESERRGLRALQPANQALSYLMGKAITSNVRLNSNINIRRAAANLGMKPDTLFRHYSGDLVPEDREVLGRILELAGSNRGTYDALARSIDVELGGMKAKLPKEKLDELMDKVRGIEDVVERLERYPEAA